MERRNGMTRVTIISNDIVPGFGLPVAAPGLRAHGIAEGLRLHQLDVITTVPKHIVRREWGKLSTASSWPTPKGCYVVSDNDLRNFVENTRSDAVILINANKIDFVHDITPSIIYDFFAPKVLEKECGASGIGAADDVSLIRTRKLRALDRAAIVSVNGRKKISYARDWISRARQGNSEIPVTTVNMPVTPLFRERAGSEAITLGMAGYLQPWLRFGNTLTELRDALDSHPNLRLDMTLPTHWGGVSEEHPDQRALEALTLHPRVATHGPQLYENFRRSLAAKDIFIDIFQRTRERELAMVTRTIIALASGVPVIHPPWTECSELVADYDAGWLIDPTEPGNLRSTLTEIAGRPAVVDAKRANARKLAMEKLDPKAATDSLARIIKELQ